MSEPAKIAVADFPPAVGSKADCQGNALHGLHRTLGALIAYCRENDWAGYDPYDALNSRLFSLLPFLDARLPRLALTQFLKRSPVNFRKPLLVPKTQNPKAIALFLSAFVRLSKQRGLDESRLFLQLAQRLVDLRSDGSRHYCWGYSFPWQTRTVLVPRGAPNLVCTCFVGNALLDLFEFGGDARYLEMASSAADYIHSELLWSGPDVAASLAYPTPSSRVPVHNANFLGAALLCRVYRHTGASRLREAALGVTRYSASRQRVDGSWLYGESPKQAWVDNFHTGYNLCALQEIGSSGETNEFASHVERGFAFYRNHFFGKDGAAGYFSDRADPIDIHSVAQSIITLLAFGDREFATRVYGWAMTHMHSKHGYFYYQVRRFYTNRISYMRWSQAWMLLALAELLGESGGVARATDGVTEAGPSNVSANVG